jgi:hypothetical protein
MRTWPVAILLPPLLLLATGCSASGTSVDVRVIDASWRAGEYPEESFDTMQEAIEAVGKGDPTRPGSIPTLCRVTMKNPSELTRADALRAAWRLGVQLPVEAYRVDELNPDFNERVMRLDALLSGSEDVDAGLSAVELADWLGDYRFPPQKVELALSLSEAVTSRAIVHAGHPVGDAFAQHGGSCLRHALVLVTMYAVDDKAPVVRTEAAIAMRYLDPEAAMILLRVAVQRESDAQVVFHLLDSVEILAPQLDPERLRITLAEIADSHDVAVRRRARQVLAQLPPPT